MWRGFASCCARLPPLGLTVIEDLMDQKVARSLTLEILNSSSAATVPLPDCHTRNNVAVDMKRAK